ncbi:hypothetical protein OIV83_002408 [Microbotryomycetes sp. JL201]|nr:hypothetical protein OIV83_002408 [Microbotryomycetes sp. JL201]
MSDGLKVALHPLPVLNISEHLTRVSLQHRDPNVKIVGALLGTQAGRAIEIMNTFELVIETAQDGRLNLDHAYFVTRADQFKQVFPSFDFLGWYTIGDEPSSQDIELHKQFFGYNETPLLLQLSKTRTSDDNKTVPVTVYESLIEVIDNEPQVVFVKTDYEIETGEAERVAVDHVAKASGGDQGGQSSIIANLTTQRNAIQMLADRVQVIVQYLQAIQAGTAPRDEETLRMISALCTSLPATDAVEFQQEFMTEYNDVLLTTYLATLTKQLSTANNSTHAYGLQLLDKQLLLVANSGIGAGRASRSRVKSSS